VLRNIKKGRAGKEQTVDNFVETVEQIHDMNPKQPPQKEEHKTFADITKCDMGNSPEVQARELLNAQI
jgi:hypothetical protein